MRRRSFLALASGLFAPMPEPLRAYSFVGGWRGAAYWRGALDELLSGFGREGLLVAPRNLIAVRTGPNAFHVMTLERQFWNDSLGIPFKGRA